VSVKDSSGALVQGATITLADQATDNKYHAVSNGSAGFYVFPIIEPARYLITITSKGFATETRTAELLVDQPATLDFTLSVKSDAVTVDVSSAAETLDFTDATMGNSVGNTTIEALPMDGRNPINLLSLQPGVLYMGSEVVDSRQGAVAGGRSDQGNITLDGLDDNDQIFGTAFTGILRSTLDSTEEFRVTTSNGTAASGRSSGAQINLVTKSGTNHYHGALYEYYRPDNVVANQYFLKYNEVSTPNTPNVPPFYLVNTFGGALGAPIMKDKLFYFFNYEGQRIATRRCRQPPCPHPLHGRRAELRRRVHREHGYPDARAGRRNGSCPAPPTPSMGLRSAPMVRRQCRRSQIPGPPSPPRSAPSAATAASTAVRLFLLLSSPSTLNTSILKIDYNMNSKNHFFVRGNLQKDTTAGDENFPWTARRHLLRRQHQGHELRPHLDSHRPHRQRPRYGYIRQGWQSGGIAPGEWVDIFGLTQPTAQTGTTQLHVPVNNITDTLTGTRARTPSPLAETGAASPTTTAAIPAPSTAPAPTTSTQTPAICRCPPTWLGALPTSGVWLGQISWASSLSSPTFTTTPSPAPPPVLRLPPVHRSPRTSTPTSGRATCRTPGTPAPISTSPSVCATPAPDPL
jgi:hypothetical protein